MCTAGSKSLKHKSNYTLRKIHEGWPELENKLLSPKTEKQNSIKNQFAKTSLVYQD
jgi:hypothetical protein